MDTINNQEFLEFKGHTNCINSVNYSHDGRFIVSASDDYSVRVWDSETGEELYKIENDYSVTSALFSPDGKYIASEIHNYASGNSLISLWETNTHNNIFSIKGSSATFSRDSQLLGTSSDADIHIWSIEEGTEVHRIKDSIKKYTRTCLAFCPDCQRIISAFGKDIRIWETKDIADGKTLNYHGDCVTCIAISPDGSKIASGSKYSGVPYMRQEAEALELGLIDFDTSIRILNKTTGKEIHLLNNSSMFPEDVYSIDFSPDGKKSSHLLQLKYGILTQERIYWKLQIYQQDSMMLDVFVLGKMVRR